MHEWTRALESIATAAKAVMDLRADPDWRTAFRAAQRDLNVVGSRLGLLREFTLEGVVRVIARVNGSCTGSSWIGAFELSDGRFVFVRAWCDHTSHGDGFVAGACLVPTLTDLVRWGIWQNERARFGDQLPVIDPA